MAFVLYIYIFLIVAILAEGVARAADCVCKLEDIENALNEMVHDSNPEDELFKVQILAPKADVYYSSQICEDCILMNQKISPNRIEATLSIKSINLTQKIIAKYEFLTYVPMLKKDMHKGQVIKEDDILYTPHPKQRVGSNIITSQEEMVGLSPKSTLRANKPVMNHALETPILIKKNSVVEVSFINKGITLKTKAIALEPGRMDQLIRLKNINSNKEIQGIVKGPYTVQCNIAQ